MQLLSLGQRERQLRPSLLEVQLQRDERESLALDGPNQSTDFPAVEQQFATSRGLVIDVPTLVVGGDVRIQEKDLAVPNDAVRVGDVRLAVAQRLDLGA